MSKRGMEITGGRELGNDMRILQNHFSDKATFQAEWLALTQQITMRWPWQYRQGQVCTHINMHE